ncbi:hypothetical protein ACFC0N_18095 [Streptomyces zaomyceticus]|uniref:hypothetical protein n=1 Tax=Streptomyces zaomyceticus TaxID=68286 RepID=UPI0035E11E39
MLRVISRLQVPSGCSVLSPGGHVVEADADQLVTSAVADGDACCAGQEESTEPMPAAAGCACGS